MSDGWSLRSAESTEKYVGTLSEESINVPKERPDDVINCRRTIAKLGTHFGLLRHAPHKHLHDLPPVAKVTLPQNPRRGTKLVGHALQCRHRFEQLFCCQPSKLAIIFDTQLIQRLAPTFSKAPLELCDQMLKATGREVHELTLRRRGCLTLSRVMVCEEWMHKWLCIKWGTISYYLNMWGEKI